MTATPKLQPSSMTKPIPFIDLESQQKRIRPQIDAAIKRVLDHGKYIMGPEVGELEERLAEYCGAKYCISCSSGTDAILMSLMAYGIGRGDAVFIPAMTFPATPEAVTLLGATPVFVDIDPRTFNIDQQSVLQGLEAVKIKGLTPKAIMAVDLYGQPADYPALSLLAQKHNLFLIADAAQSFGASLNDKKVGSLTPITATSFFPAKPLGCYGDGGAVFTDDDELASTLRSIRVHGKGSDKYDIVRIGLNARMDTIQAAILLEKLKIFDDEVSTRQKVADFYEEALKDSVEAPYMMSGSTSAWAQYTVTLPKGADRPKLMDSLKSEGIPTMVYYPRPLHKQTAYKHFPTATGGALPVSEDLSERVLSLPMSESSSAYIAKKLKGLI